MSKQLSRRGFLWTSTCAITAGTTARAVRRASAQVSPNEKLRLGLIGCGGQGLHVGKRVIQAGVDGVELVAVADPDTSKREDAVQYFAQYGHADPDAHNHFMKIIERKDIDLVVVATPDHWHAICTILACQSGKDVYVEKPCSHNIHEGRQMVRAARKHGRIVQVGQQQRSQGHFREAAALLQKDKPLGRIVRTRTMNFENEAPNGIGNPPDQPSPPPGVDYDLWLGPAPQRPFNKNRFHGTFRWFFDYAAGMQGDWNVHLQDIVHMVTRIDAPRTVCALGGKRVLNDNRETPDMMDVLYDYGDFTHVYTMSKAYQRGGNPNNYGIEFFGPDGSLFIKRSYWEFIPETAGNRKPSIEGFKKDGVPDGVDHQGNWLDCVRSRRHEDLVCDIETGHRTATACHLGNISLKLGRQIRWDAKRELIVDDNGRTDAAANVHLTREYRKGYELPEV